MRRGRSFGPVAPSPGCLSMSDKTVRFFAWIDPDGTVRAYDGLDAAPTARILGRWSSVEISGRHCVSFQSGAHRYVALLDWPPVTGEGANARGSVALFRGDPARQARGRRPDNGQAAGAADPRSSAVPASRPAIPS